MTVNKTLEFKGDRLTLPEARLGNLPREIGGLTLCCDVLRGLYDCVIEPDCNTVA